MSASAIEIPKRKTQSLESWSYWITNDTVTSAAMLEPTDLTMLPISSPTRSFARARYSRLSPAATANTGQCHQEEGELLVGEVLGHGLEEHLGLDRHDDRHGDRKCVREHQPALQPERRRFVVRHGGWQFRPGRAHSDPPAPSASIGRRSRGLRSPIVQRVAHTSSSRPEPNAHRRIRLDCRPRLRWAPTAAIAAGTQSKRFDFKMPPPRSRGVVARSLARS